MVTGAAPFGDSEHLGKYELFTNISERVILYPLLMNWHLKQLLKGLLNRDPNKRFNWLQVSASKWLANVQWDLINTRRVKPPWIPKASAPGSPE